MIKYPVFLDMMNLDGLGESISNFFAVVFTAVGFVIAVLLMSALINTNREYKIGNKTKQNLINAIICNIVFDVLYVIYIFI
ncbi:MAG: hypothetical protein J5372_02835 [Lachnospiraceae bacterium]|nr:hypothetical protein [Lachnospiraceae bacterium]